jgi:FKBP-type peptidyl-prolyl cis-trans isomerase
MSRRSFLAPAVVALALTTILVACGGDDDAGSAGSTATTAPTGDSVTDVSLVPATQVSVPSIDLPTATPTELKSTVVTAGTGTPAANGDTVFVRYVGVTSKDGKQFDTNYGPTGIPLGVTLGQGGVIKGWDQGLVGVTDGERLQLDIPADLAYGDAPPDGSTIGKGDALTFVIDVLAVVPPVDASKAPTGADLPPPTEVEATVASVDELVVGTGAELAAGGTGIFHLVYFRADDHSVLQSTWTTQPVALPAGEGDVTTSPSAAFAGMKVGGRRAITIPAQLAGLQPAGDMIAVADLIAVI